MRALKKSLLIMFCLAISLAGFPVMASAKSQCPMAAKMQMQHMDMKDCKGCVKTAGKQEQKKGGCCGDMACVAKCSSMSNASPTFFGTQQIASLSLVGIAERFYGSDHVLASHLLNTQDRPPKYLS
ncbi:MAG: hypothetical protein KGI29_03295 [Pseudomonadota bacterium]|nr:hypothetical protein [Pseudomonadota bacterium]MDE3037145.1 hypothetical protein [Pseudomonadota bacterium]